jgi:hypothetical protein
MSNRDTGGLARKGRFSDWVRLGENQQLLALKAAAVRISNPRGRDTTPEPG